MVQVPGSELGCMGCQSPQMLGCLLHLVTPFSKCCARWTSAWKDQMQKWSGSRRPVAWTLFTEPGGLAAPEALLPVPFVPLALSALLNLYSSPPLCLEGRGFHCPSRLLLTCAILPQTPGMPVPFLPTPLNLSKFLKEETYECFLPF